MILYINTYKVKPGMMDALVKELNDSGIEKQFRSIPGNVVFNYSIAAKGPDTFYLVDLWETEEGFQAHLKSDALKVWHAIKDKYFVGKENIHYDF